LGALAFTPEMQGRYHHRVVFPCTGTRGNSRSSRPPGPQAELSTTISQEIAQPSAGGRVLLDQESSRVPQP
jgi:hypothetical protein